MILRDLCDAFKGLKSQKNFSVTNIGIFFGVYKYLKEFT